MRRWGVWLGWVALGLACSRGAGPGAPLSSPGPTPDPGASPLIDRTTPLPSPVPDVVARVNGRPIYLRQIVGLAREALDRSEDREKDKPGALREAMHQYVVRELLLQEALARDLSADPGRLEETYNEFRLKHRDEQAWAEHLATQGLTPQAFREELRVQQTVQALVDAESVEVSVTEQEARDYLGANPNAFGLGDRARVARILFPCPRNASAPLKAQARARAETALRRIREGADFAEVARAAGNERARPLELGRGEWPGPLEDAAFALEPGGVSEVLESADGFEILKLLERRTEPVAFDRVRGLLEPLLLREKRRAALQQLVAELRARARIETFL